MNLNQGMLISFEGMEGAGKTTQCEVLAKKLEQAGHQVVVIREPGGVPIAEEIRQVVLRPRDEKMGVMTEVLLFQAARAQLYEEVVLPSLAKKMVVLMDRTRDSSTVYQGMVRGIGVEKIEQLNDIATHNTTPALTFLLDLPPAVGLDRRAKAGKMDRIEQEGLGLQEKVCKAYLEVAHQNKDGRWVIIDGSQSQEAVEAQVWEQIQKVI